MSGNEFKPREKSRADHSSRSSSPDSPGQTGSFFDLVESETDRLESEIRRHNRLYWVEAKPEITDEKYDLLVEKLRTLSPQSPVLQEIGAGAPPVQGSREQVVDPGKVWVHQRPMLSLDKCYDAAGLTRWAGRLEGGGVVASPKVDGVACALIYGEDGELQVAATRGDGVRGELITRQAKTVTGIPKRIRSGRPMEVRGEVYMPLSVFQSYRDRFANPRNLAAGALKQKDPARTAAYRLSFFAYDLVHPVTDNGDCPSGQLGGNDSRHGPGTECGDGAPLSPPPGREEAKLRALGDLGFQTIPHILIEDHRRIGEMEDAYRSWADHRRSLDYEIDGVVYKADRLDLHEKMGSTAHHPRYAIAYKLPTEAGTTTLVEVRWSVSRSGTVTPVAIVEPVELSGATITRVTLHNTSIFSSLGLSGSCTLRVVRRGGVIPYVESVEAAGDSGPLVIPSRCPSCDSVLYLEGDFLKCPNTASCPEQQIGRVEHYLKSLDIDGFGRAILEQLHKRALVRDIPDLYRLREEDLVQLERMGEILAAKLVGAVQQTRELELSVFLRALGLEEIGPHVAGILQREYGTLEVLMEASEEDLVALHGIGKITARSVVDGLRSRRELVDNLLDTLRILPPAPAADRAGVDGQNDDALPHILAGKSVVFTGKLQSITRKEAQTMVLSVGGSCPADVSANLDYLVVGGDGLEQGPPTSSKQRKAIKLREAGGAVRIISEAEFKQMLQ